MIEELRDLNASKTFTDWMTYLNGGIPECITKERLINGLCEDLAYYLHIKYDVEIIYANYFISAGITKHEAGHYFVRNSDGLYYDGWSVDGVCDPWDLQWSKDILNSTLGYNPGFRIWTDVVDSSWYLSHTPELLRILKGEIT